MLHSIYDLTTNCRKTTGDVPAKLVGASTTVVGSSMYLFGGRQVAERKMVSDLYRFDLDTLVWSRMTPHPDDDVPCSRYFHSSDAWGNFLIIFGGMSNQPDSPNPEELCVLNDVRLFDLETSRWLPPAPDNGGDSPRARYAHLSSVTADRLFVIGGQDFYNTWLDDVCVYDLLARTWVQKRDYPRHCGTYRSVAVASDSTVRFPKHQDAPRFPTSPTPYPDTTPPESFVFHPYSASPTEDHPADIYLYSNYNFTDVKRELEVFSPLPDTDFTISDRSSAMTGSTFPPGLRFPTGAILGTHLIIAGTYLAHSYQSFSIWVLDLQTMQWSRIDPGKAVESGSWFRGCLAAQRNKFYIFGNRDGNLVDDYNRRLLSWEHVAIVDLEAFGIYQPPPAKVDISMQELGLSALEEGVLADFDIVCEDGRKVSVSRKLIEERWPWFREQRIKMLHAAMQAMEGQATSPMHTEAPTNSKGPDPRLTSRALHISEPYPIVLALTQYFYAQALITPLQQAPAVLSQLLILATNYQITHLEQLVKHAMHRALSNSTSVGVYEVATLCNCRSLQIRALKTVMSYTQKRPGNKGKDGRGPPPPSNPDLNSNGRNNGELYSRPRGTSDARWRTAAGNGGESSGTYGGGRQVPSRTPVTHDEDFFEEDEPAPLPLFTPRTRHSRTPSIVSVATDQALHETVELFSPFSSPVSPSPGRPERPQRESGRMLHPFDESESEDYEVEGLHVYMPSYDKRSSSATESTAPSLVSASSSSSRHSSTKGPVTPVMSPLSDIDESRMSSIPSSSMHRPSSSNSYTATETDSDEMRWPKQKSTIEWVTSRAGMTSPSGTILPVPDSPTNKKGFKSLFGGKGKTQTPTQEMDLKEQMKEQKRRKAEDKRLRMERLAEDLKARAKARKEAEDNASLSSGERNKRRVAVANMYGGIGGMIS